MKAFILAISLFAFFIVQAQPNSPASPQKDSSGLTITTDTVLIWYVTDIIQGSSNTAMALRVTKSKLDFVQPSPNDLQKDSFTVKKQRVPVSTVYYVPVAVIDSSVIRKNKSRMTSSIYQTAIKTVYVPLPSDLLLYDFNRNFNALLPKLNNKPTKK